MLRIGLVLGMSMSLASGVMMLDHRQQSAASGGDTLQLGAYFSGLGSRSMNLMEKEVGPRIASLPQVARGMMTTSVRDQAFDPNLTSDQQIDEFAKDSPQLQALLKADRAAAKKTFWARIRQKVVGEEKQQTGGRLTAIRERNFPSPRQGIDPNSLKGKNAVELYTNRRAIQQGMANTVYNNMQSMKGF